jgi:aldose 1-epimerase
MVSLELQSGPLRLARRPDVGGSIAGLWFDGLPVLRSVEPAELEHARFAASFVLAPYSNRLGYRRFRWHGHDYTTQPNDEPGAPHSLHGVAWQRAWQVDEAGPTSAVLSYRHQPDAHWPFAFTVRQRVAIDDGAFDASLALRNDADVVAPLGFGWHPYFPKRERSRIHLEVAERWDRDATLLPTRRVAQPGIDGDVAHLDFDHVFDGWDGAARIRDEKLSLKLTSSLRRVVVFTPPTKPLFCIEPVSHVNNAIHMADPLAHGLAAVAPGGSIEATMRLTVARI